MVTGCVQCFFLPMDHAPGLAGWTGHVHHVLLYIFFSSNNALYSEYVLTVFQW